ncbi:hypothetical protein NDU88_004498 [Pleurodeles waltl]|uniref:Uncharacterized protein n=1 Tax=Pleurodeles waltl TaxID=8319 RepID=A0AAV7QFL8_PLEWA|nr:hypothetical protein NDU88_004498 [Pleurodeles waltl]
MLSRTPAGRELATSALRGRHVPHTDDILLDSRIPAIVAYIFRCKEVVLMLCLETKESGFVVRCDHEGVSMDI